MSNRIELGYILISGDGILVFCLGATYTFTKACGVVVRGFKAVGRFSWGGGGLLELGRLRVWKRGCGLGE